MDHYLHVLKNYFQFSGRARRQEYWIFTLVNLLVTALAIVIDNITGLTVESEFYGLFYILYCLAVMIPGLAVAIRRLHDTGRSGWYFLLAFIPVVGSIWLLILFCLNGETGPNQYGENPKETEFLNSLDPVIENPEV